MEIESLRMTKNETQVSEGNKRQLAEAFHYVRETFFPKWRKGDEWTVKEDPTLPYYGWCDDSNRTILIRSTPEEDDILHLILIHEICHAITREPHTKKWRDRFEQAGNTAMEIGRQELANLIYDEVRRSSENVKPPRLNERLIYSTIEDVILDDPQNSYEDTIKTVAKLWGIAPEDVTELENCESVYEETIRMISQFMSQIAAE